jgi:protein-tyrosine phosphatase
MKILMVCLGNICRSPLAMEILRKKAEEATLDITVDSAGFEPYHIGDVADRRSADIAKKHNLDLSEHRARLFQHDDFEKYDKIYVMDQYNYEDVKYMAKNDDDMKKVDLILNVLYPGENKDIADPYYGGINGFENVYNALDKVSDEIIRLIKENKL